MLQDLIETIHFDGESANSGLYPNDDGLAMQDEPVELCARLRATIGGLPGPWARPGH